MDPESIPNLEKESMQSSGDVKVQDVIHYLFYSDKLNRFFKDVPAAKDK